MSKTVRCLKAYQSKEVLLWALHQEEVAVPSRVLTVTGGGSDFHLKLERGEPGAVAFGSDRAPLPSQLSEFWTGTCLATAPMNQVCQCFCKVFENEFSCKTEPSNFHCMVCGHCFITCFCRRCRHLLAVQINETVSNKECSARRWHDCWKVE